MLKQSAYLLGLLAFLLGLNLATVTAINYQTWLEFLIIAFVFETIAIALLLYSYSLGGWRRNLFCIPGLVLSTLTVLFVLLRFSTEYQS
jgi:hypothetical protein